MLFSFQQIAALKKRPKMTKHRDNDNPNHKQNLIEFSNIHGRKNPVTMKSNRGCCHFVMATNGNKLKQNNKAMLAVSIMCVFTIFC